MNPWTIGDGAYIRIRFSEPLVGAITGNQAHFTVSWMQYDYVPGGALVEQEYTPLAVHTTDSNDELVLEMPTLHHFYNAVGQITIAYDGAGTLAGDGGAVEAFEFAFTPTDLIPKPNQNDAEHIELSAAALGVLTRIYWRNAQNEEHVSFSAAASGVLTHVDDL